jgi:multisubunit Na+/H+ antiporter MnhB subunit
MNGRAFVVGFILFMLAFIVLAVLFNFYPPAANSWWTALGVAVYAAVSVLIVRGVARR